MVAPPPSPNDHDRRQQRWRGVYWDLNSRQTLRQHGPSCYLEFTERYSGPCLASTNQDQRSPEPPHRSVASRSRQRCPEGKQKISTPVVLGVHDNWVDRSPVVHLRGPIRTRDPRTFAASEGRGDACPSEQGPAGIVPPGSPPGNDPPFVKDTHDDPDLCGAADEPPRELASHQARRAGCNGHSRPHGLRLRPDQRRRTCWRSRARQQCRCIRPSLPRGQAFR